MAVTALPARHQALAIELDDGALLQIDALGNVGRLFRLDLFGTARISSHEIVDNFSMFRRLLFRFVRSVREGGVAVPAADTLASLRTLIAGRRALGGRTTVRLDDVDV